MALTKITGNVIETGAVTSASINTESIATAVANDGLVANSSGIFVNASDGLHANSSGVRVLASEGLHANSSGVRVLANNGLSANSSGTFVVGGTGVTSNATGVHIGQAVATTSDVTFANVTQTASIIGTHAITSNTTHLLLGSVKLDAVDTAIANLVASAPGTLDTLNEIATALGSDPDLANTLTTSIATKMPIAGGTFTGAVTGTSFTAPSGFLGGVEGGIRIHSTGTKFFNIYANNTARDATMDIGASDARFKDLHLSANAYIGGGIIDYGSSGTLKLQENGTIAVEIEPRNIILSNHVTLGRIKSGADTILGHNVYAGANTNTLLQTNNSYYGAWIRMYYNEGISFGTVTSAGTADDTVWTRADESNEKMRLTNDGKLGIGTLDPGHRLEVITGGNVINSVKIGSSSSENEKITLGHFNNALTNGLPGLLNGSQFGGIIQGGENGKLILGIRDNDVTDSVDIVSGGGNYMTDTTFDTLVASFRADGKVGIGTNNPAAKLDVYQGELKVTGTLANWSVDYQGVVMDFTRASTSYIRASNAAGQLQFQTGGSNNRMIINSSGNIGIANATPQALLHIHGETNSWAPSPTILFTSSGTNTNVRNWRIGPADTNYGNFHIAKSDVIGGIPDSTAEASTFTIDNQGNVGIGTVSPDKKLTISANTNPAIKLNDEDSSKYWYKQLESDGVVRTYMNTVLIKEEFPNGEVVRRSAENFNLGGWDWRNSLLLAGNTMDGYAYPTSNYSPSDPIGPYVNGYKVWYPDVNIRFNQNAVYTCSLTVFQVNDGGGVGCFYGGFICKDKNFNTLQVDGIGTYQYIMGSCQTHTTGNRYTYTVTVQGTAGSGVTNYTKLDAGTVWISPMMLINYANSNGQQTVIENFTVSARGV